jgi:hypothetical protein
MRCDRETKKILLIKGERESIIIAASTFSPLHLSALDALCLATFHSFLCLGGFLYTRNVFISADFLKKNKREVLLINHTEFVYKTGQISTEV